MSAVQTERLLMAATYLDELTAFGWMGWSDRDAWELVLVTAQQTLTADTQDKAEAALIATMSPGVVRQLAVLLREIESCIDPLDGLCSEDVVRAADAVAAAILGPRS